MDKKMDEKWTKNGRKMGENCKYCMNYCRVNHCKLYCTNKKNNWPK